MADKIHQLFSGIQAIHMTNHTHTTREGYIQDDDLRKLKELTYDGYGSTYYELTQGMYRININGTVYVFLLHDTLYGADKLIINTPTYAFYMTNLVRKDIYLYKVHDRRLISKYGYDLLHTVNDDLDIIVFDGYTKIDDTVVNLSLDRPRELHFTSMYNIRVRDDITKEYNDYIFDTKSYLKKLNGYIFDRIYVNKPMRRALFEFKLQNLILTGQEDIKRIDKYDGNKYCVYFLKNTLVKPNGKLRCTHLKELKWNQVTSKTYDGEGICIGKEYGNNQGFYLRVNKYKYPTVKSVQEIIQNYYQNRNVRSKTHTKFLIMYELNQPMYREVFLDNYAIPLKYNRCHLSVAPYKFRTQHVEDFDTTLVGVVPKDGIMKTMYEQELESGIADKYEQILMENYILRDLIYKHYGSTFIPYINDDRFIGTIPKDGDVKSYIEQRKESGNPAYYERILEENRIVRNLSTEYLDGVSDIIPINDDRFVGVVPKDGVMKTSAQQELESGEEAFYEQILRENYIIRNLMKYNIKVYNKFYGDGNNIYDLDYNRIDAVIPKDGVIKSSEEQALESGYEEHYPLILKENYILRDLYMTTGEYLINVWYFYKHFKLHD